MSLKTKIILSSVIILILTFDALVKVAATEMSKDMQNLISKDIESYDKLIETVRSKIKLVEPNNNLKIDYTLRSPEEILESGKGDLKDIALVIAYIISAKKVCTLVDYSEIRCYLDKDLKAHWFLYLDRSLSEYVIFDIKNNAAWWIKKKSMDSMNISFDGGHNVYHIWGTWKYQQLLNCLASGIKLEEIEKPYKNW